MPSSPMRRRVRFQPGAALVFFVLMACAAPGADAMPPPIPVSEITAGMTGYGLTVFAGSRVDTFSVRVLGVQPNARAQGSLVLVEVGGHGLELSSIAQGMSGSPVFLDGRFAGALAFGWEGSLSPIGGVTPAEEMLALPAEPSTAAAPRHGGVWDPRVLIGERTGTLASVLSGEVASGGSASPRVPSAVDQVGGWPDPLELAAVMLEPLTDTGSVAAPSWLCLPTGAGAAIGAAGGTNGGAMSADTSARLQPGSACAVSLVSGDAALGAIGTVTWVDGDRVLMMGHPLLQRGAVNLPLASADIVTVLPSRRISFKMGSPGPVVGAVHHDLRAGLAGRLGDVAPVVPVTVRVEGPSPGTFRFAVADDAQLTPLLVFWSFYNALLAKGDDASRQTIDWRLDTTWRQAGRDDAQTLSLNGVAAGPGGAGALAGEIMAPLTLMLENPYGEVSLRSAAFTAEVRPGRSDAAIIALGGPRRIAAGTRALALTVELRDADGRRELLPVEVTLPASLAPGAYRLVAASAAEFFAFEAQRAPERLQPARLADLWELLQTERSPATLVVALFAAERPSLIGGRELAAAPGSVSRLVAAGRQPAEQAMAQFSARQALPTRWTLGGHAVRTLEVLPPTAAVGNGRRP